MSFVLEGSVKLLDLLEHVVDDSEPLLVLRFGDWGKHRSVAMAWLISTRLNNVGHQAHLSHMNKKR